jgi:hypothetical protein
VLATRAASSGSLAVTFTVTRLESPSVITLTSPGIDPPSALATRSSTTSSCNSRTVVAASRSGSLDANGGAPELGSRKMIDAEVVYFRSCSREKIRAAAGTKMSGIAISSFRLHSRRRNSWRPDGSAPAKIAILDSFVPYEDV